MIRASDLPNAAVWARPITTGPRNDTRDASNWFDGSAAEARISGDLNPAARGLSVAQHASLVLAHLRGE
jgi:hypothetical protein